MKALAAELEVDTSTTNVYDVYGLEIQSIPEEQVSNEIDNVIPKAEIPELEVIETEQDEIKEETVIVEEEVTDANEKQEEKITVNSRPAYSLSDKELLAQLMYAEEGIFFREYDEDSAKVERVHKLAGSAAIHRLENNHMGANSLADVLYAKGQYAQQTISKVEKGQNVPEIVYVWAEQLLSEGPIGPKGMIYQAQFVQGEFYEQIGNQIFGIDPKYN